MANNTNVRSGGRSNNGDDSHALMVRMATQIDDIYKRIEILDGLVTDLLPGIQKIPDELNRTLNDLRMRFERDETLTLLKKVGDNIPTFIKLIEVMEAASGMADDLIPAASKIPDELNSTINGLRMRFERDETLTLLKKVGDNIPTFIQLLDVMEAVKGMMEDLAPAATRIPDELNSSLNALRMRFERDETLTLLKKVGDNIPTFIQLMEIMEAVKGMMEDLAPAAARIPDELNATINALRSRYERDETLELMKRVGDNIPVFLKGMDYFEAMKGMAEDLAPALDKIVHETTPAINTLRIALEKDEVLTLLKKTGDNLPNFIKLLDFLEKFSSTGDLEFNLNSLLAKETKFFLEGLETSAIKTMDQFMVRPFEPGMKNVLSAMRDPDVQKGILFMTTLLKNLHQHMLETVSVAIMDELTNEEAKKGGRPS